MMIAPHANKDATVSIMIVIGTRPEAIKLAPVVQSIKSSSWANPCVVLTGQHSDLIDPLIESFGLEVHHHLHVMQPRQSLASVTARILEKLDHLLIELNPQAVIGQVIPQVCSQEVWQVSLERFHLRMSKQACVRVTCLHHSPKN